MVYDAEHWDAYQKREKEKFEKRMAKLGREIEDLKQFEKAVRKLVDNLNPDQKRKNLIKKIANSKVYGGQDSYFKVRI